MLWVFTVLLSLASAEIKPNDYLKPAALQLLSDVAGNYINEPPDQKNLYSEYDFIIVGAGTAGCVMANRLTENPNWKVLLIEAGSREFFLMDVPLLAYPLQLSWANWRYYTEPSNTSCLGHRDGRCHLPRGKVMGGTSVLNFMIYTRGNRRDYDLWKYNGNTGWGWSDVLPYFKKVESFEVPEYSAPEMHGYNGYMTVSYAPYVTKIGEAFVDAGKYLNPPAPAVDYNGRTQTGINYLQVRKEGLKVLPYFKKVESFEVPEYSAPEMHGYNGYMTVSYAPYVTKIGEVFVDAGKYLNPPVPTVDYNGRTETVISYLQVSMKNGTRWSSSRAYLHSIRRKNLHVTKKSLATRILIDPITKVAYGVEFVKNRKTYIIRARKEVILSAGAINTPQLLMLSGIGPKDHLEELGIPVLKDSKVGFNLQDHISPSLTYKIDKPYSIIVSKILKLRTLSEFYPYHRGPLAIPGSAEALVFYDSQNPNATDGWADLELLLSSTTIGAQPLVTKIGYNVAQNTYDEMYRELEFKDGFMLLPIIMRPKSTGRIKLRNTNPKSHPLITTGYYTDPEGYDIKMAIKGIKKCNELVDSPLFKAMGTTLHKKPPPQCKKHEFGSDQFWECYARHITFSYYHIAGTAKMGAKGDPTAVVDPRLRVYGIKNLRVVDASAIPIIPAAHISAPIYMMAEKASDMIKEDYGCKI